MFFLVIDKGPSPILKPLERGKTETAQFSSEKNPDCSVIARLVRPIHPQHVVLWLLVLIWLLCSTLRATGAFL